MAKNTNYVSHKKSKTKIEGKPKLPLASSLVEGEIAVNFAENVETLSIKNESGTVVAFSSDNYYTQQKLGSGFTGANSAVTVTEALENIEIDVDQVIDSGTSASTNAVATKAVYEAITDNELVWTNAYVAMSGIVSAHTASTEIHLANGDREKINSIDTLSGTVTAHTANTEIHVTAADKEKLHTHSNISALDAITGNVGTMAYENANSYSSATEVNTALGNKANTATTLAGYSISDAYTKSETSGATEISNALGAKVNTSDIISAITPSNSGSTAPIATKVVAENELVMTNALTDLDERKLDASAYTEVNASSEITSMAGYSKPSVTSAIATTDTLNQAVGKLECAFGGMKLEKITQAAYDALSTKDSNTLYIITD